ncbi:hypothetical protein GCHA_0464 [Paraglaciecola chathamensis S18K6]|uniref:Uncharacterized protein n=2 Tax=Paraglaciecola chathamensis TaxID=368405 RepID=A0ABQ0ICD3_9ALTE|nr:hypothetical protein GAGA_4100 [Paraglaciecola agarilytica NO2]GAC08428.1 hypothetical protein GCHA_0464 [Paraglaciecola chathamensis S18K6]
MPAQAHLVFGYTQLEIAMYLAHQEHKASSLYALKNLNYSFENYLSLGTACANTHYLKLTQSMLNK